MVRVRVVGAARAQPDIRWYRGVVWVAQAGNAADWLTTLAGVAWFGLPEHGLWARRADAVFGPWVGTTLVKLAVAVGAELVVALYGWVRRAGYGGTPIMFWLLAVVGTLELWDTVLGNVRALIHAWR